MRYFAHIKYHGKAFHGWQRQLNALAVQEVLENKLSQMLRKEVSITGCGRTDTGVHASQFYFHFDTDAPLPEGFAYKLNTFVPKSIAIMDLHIVDDEAHTRFDATQRAYRYFLHQKPDPFLEDTSLFYPYELNFEAMNTAAKALLTIDDFACFQRSGTDNKTTICDVRSAQWSPVAEQPDRFYFEITADRFLRNMVRAIVGTLLDVGRGKISHTQWLDILASKDRRMAGTSAHAHGLFLTEVRYPFL